MRLLIKPIKIGIIVLCALSCSKFLEETPVTSLTEKDIYSSPEALEKCLNGIVMAFQGDAMFQGNMMENLQSASGLVHWGSASFLNDERWKCVLRTLTYSPGTSYNTNMYGGLYSAVNRCNKLLDALPDSPVDESYKSEIEGEAKFYRGVLFFCIARLYGDAPLPLHHATNESATALPRMPYYQVYSQSVVDLKDAFSLMRSPERVSQVTGTQGHPNRWAAESFLAAVYLQIASILHVPENENFYNPEIEARRPDFSGIGIASETDAWDSALSSAKNVIENGPYKLAANYADLFKWTRGYRDSFGKDCWNLDERIFVLQSTGANITDYTAVRTLPKYPEGCTVTSPASTSGRIRPTRFLFQKWCERTGGSLGEPGSDAEDIYVSTTDPRLDISLIHSQFKKADGSGIQYVYPWSAVLYATAQGSVMPYFRKYYTKTFIGKPDVADYYFMRFSELYYIAAEASARLGDSNAAYDYVEEVHRRARTSSADGIEAPQPQWTKGCFSNEDELVNAIVWDKLFELCGEGHEFFEVRRYGARWLSEQIVKPINSFLQDSRQDMSLRQGNYYGQNFQYPDDVQKLRASLLCEFPSVELAMNPALSSKDKNDFSWE